MGHAQVGVVSLHIVVHPIDTERWPLVPSGFRWCVQIAGRPDDPHLWLNAGWASDRHEATFIGEQNAATATRALRAAGHSAEFRVVHLDHDPCLSDKVFTE